MQPLQIIIIIFCSACTGWLIPVFTLKILFSESLLNSFKLRLAAAAGDICQREFVVSKLIEHKIANPALFNQLKPEIEKHVDFFLNEKLATVFPLLYKFMGEKTLMQFKAAFMIEIDLLFPLIIKSYVSSLTHDMRIDLLVSEKINAISPKSIKQIIFLYAGKEILYLKLASIATGLLMGGITVVILRFT